MTTTALEQEIANALQRAAAAQIAIVSCDCTNQGDVSWKVSSERDAHQSYRVEYRNADLHCSCPSRVVCKHIGKVLLSGATYTAPAGSYGALKQQLRAGLAQVAERADGYFTALTLPVGYKLLRCFDERLLVRVWNVVRPDQVAIMNRAGHARAYANVRAAAVAATRSARMLAIIAANQIHAANQQRSAA